MKVDVDYSLNEDQAAQLMLMSNYAKEGSSYNIGEKGETIIDPGSGSYSFELDIPKPDWTSKWSDVMIRAYIHPWPRDPGESWIPITESDRVYVPAEVSIPETEPAHENISTETKPAEADGFQKARQEITQMGMRLITDTDRLLVAVENQKMDVVLGGLNIADHYIINQDGRQYILEYGWEVSFGSGGHDYNVSTTSWLFDPGKYETKDIEHMQHSFWVDSHNVANAGMSHTNDMIHWQVTVPDEYKINYDDVKEFVVSVVSEGKEQESFSVDAGQIKSESEETTKKTEENKAYQFTTRPEIGDIIRFGHYEQDNDFSNGPEPIEWRIQDILDGNALLVSNYSLERKQYHTSSEKITWENCAIRSWLNREFLNEAFSAEEQAMIRTTVVDNSSSQGRSIWKTDGGKDTEDRVFLLSYAEARQYFDTSQSRKCSPSLYAEAQRASYWWWLRSPGRSQNMAAFVGSDGSPDNSYNVNTGNGAIRPALWIRFQQKETTREQEAAPTSAPIPAAALTPNTTTAAGAEYTGVLDPLLPILQCEFNPTWETTLQDMKAVPGAEVGPDYFLLDVEIDGEAGSVISANNVSGEMEYLFIYSPDSTKEAVKKTLENSPFVERRGKGAVSDDISYYMKDGSNWQLRENDGTLNVIIIPEKNSF